MIQLKNKSPIDMTMQMPNKILTKLSSNQNFLIRKIIIHYMGLKMISTTY